jgi:hypothetical protein
MHHHLEDPQASKGRLELSNKLLSPIHVVIRAKPVDPWQVPDGRLPMSRTPDRVKPNSEGTASQRAEQKERSIEVLLRVEKTTSFLGFANQRE